jgi:hypothetical protein
MKICPTGLVENVEDFTTLFKKDRPATLFSSIIFLSLYSRTLCSPPNPQKAQLTQAS